MLGEDVVIHGIRSSKTRTEGQVFSALKQTGGKISFKLAIHRCQGLPDGSEVHVFGVIVFDVCWVKDKSMVQDAGIKVLRDYCPIESTTRAVTATMSQRRDKGEVGRLVQGYTGLLHELGLHSSKRRGW